MNGSMMSVPEILDQLDECAAAFTFPMLDNGYVYPADVRMSIFRSANEWLMIMEVLGTYTPRMSGLDSFQNCLHLFGSNLHRKPGTANEDFLYPVHSCDDDPLFEDEGDWFVSERVRSIILRGTRIELDVTPETLLRKGITLVEPPRVDPVAVLRSLLPEHRNLLLATEEQLARRNPRRLPLSPGDSKPASYGRFKTSHPEVRSS